MARQGFSRPSGGVTRSPVVAHDRWQSARSTGTVDLVLATLPGRFVSPGTGRLALLGAPGSELVAHRAARSLDEPVLPGSGIKGAVRTLYELLSFSCNPFDFTSTCGRIEACDACSLFGTHGKRGQGYAGRVTFSDATPHGAPVRSEVRWLPVGRDPDREKTIGEFRIYDLRSGEPPGAGALAPVKAAREIHMGMFRTRLSFTNATGEEIGRLLLCGGLREESESGFPLRLGGVKYEGQGAMLAEIDSLTLRFPNRVTLVGDAARAHAAIWITAALGSPWATAFRPTYDELVTVLNHQGGRP